MFQNLSGFSASASVGASPSVPVPSGSGPKRGPSSQSPSLPQNQVCDGSCVALMKNMSSNTITGGMHSLAMAKRTLIRLMIAMCVALHFPLSFSSNFALTLYAIAQSVVITLRFLLSISHRERSQCSAASETLLLPHKLCFSVFLFTLHLIATRKLCPPFSLPLSDIPLSWCRIRTLLSFSLTVVRSTRSISICCIGTCVLTYYFQDVASKRCGDSPV